MRLRHCLYDGDLISGGSIYILKNLTFLSILSFLGYMVIFLILLARSQTTLGEFPIHSGIEIVAWRHYELEQQREIYTYGQGIPLRVISEGLCFL